MNRKSEVDCDGDKLTETAVSYEPSISKFSSGLTNSYRNVSKLIISKIKVKAEKNYHKRIRRTYDIAGAK